MGQVATFSVEVSDGPVPAYQWQVSKDGSNWEDIPGATDGSYTTEATDKGMDGWKYQCVAANKAGSITSDTAILTVKSTDVSLQSVSVDGTEGTIGGTMITVVLPYGKTLPTESGKVNITPAAGATVSALAMTDSGATWTFTVTAEDGTTTADYTIKVFNAPNPAAGNIADVAAAKSMIEKYNWIVGQSDANTEAELKAWIENQINGMNLNGVDYTVSITGFTAGINGSEANKNGTDGSFSFTISLSKGAGNTFATDMVTGVTGIIAAMPYQAGEYMVSVSASPAAGGTVSGGGTYTENTSVTVTATAQGDYRFVKWTEGGREVSGSANYTFVVEGNRTLVAFFERDGDPTPPQQARYSVTVNGSYAAESGAGSYEAGATVFIYAGSRSNYRFDGWTSSDGIDFANAENASTTFIMPDKAVAVTANWTYIKDGSGGGSSDPENNTDGGTGGSFTGVKNPQTGDNGAADAGNSANSEDMAGASYSQKPAANAAGPQTGSDDSISLWETTGLCALLVGAAAVIYKRRRKTKAGTPV